MRVCTCVRVYVCVCVCARVLFCTCTCMRVLFSALLRKQHRAGMTSRCLPRHFLALFSFAFSPSRLRDRFFLVARYEHRLCISWNRHLLSFLFIFTVLHGSRRVYVPPSVAIYKFQWIATGLCCTHTPTIGLSSLSGSR